MKKKYFVWSGIALFALTLVVAGCEKEDKDEGGGKDRDEQAAPPSNNPGAGAVNPAPSGGQTNPGGNYGNSAPAQKQ